MNRELCIVVFLGSPDDSLPEWLSGLEQDRYRLSFCDEIGQIFQLAREQTVNLILLALDHFNFDLEKLVQIVKDIAWDVPIVGFSSKKDFRELGLNAPLGIDLILSSSAPFSLVMSQLQTIMLRCEELRQAKGASKASHSQLQVLKKNYSKLRHRLKELMHELTTPIAIIQGYCSNLILLEDAMAPDQKTSIERMHTASELSLSILEQIRKEIHQPEAEENKVSKAEARAYCRRQIRPCEVAEQVVSLLEQSFSHKGVSLSLVADPSCPLVWADRTRLCQLLVNLLNNALRNTSPGGYVKVILQPGPSSEIRAQQRCCQLTVEDNGSGIPEEKITDIFLPGWSLVPDQEEKRAGLGLAICKEIAIEHSAKLWVESSLGKGSSFHLLLPADPRAQIRKISCNMVEDPVLVGQLLIELQARMAAVEQAEKPTNMEELAKEICHEGGTLVILGSPEKSVKQALLGLLK